MPYLADRVKDTTTSTGTGAITLAGATCGSVDQLVLSATASTLTTAIIDDFGPTSTGTPDAADIVLASIGGPAQVIEGQTASGYFVALSQVASSDVTVQLQYSGTAQDGSDFTGVATVTVSAGAKVISAPPTEGERGPRECGSPRRRSSRAPRQAPDLTVP